MGADTLALDGAASELHATACAICGTTGNADVVYRSTFDPAALNPDVFSARRLPDRVHYQMVRCRSCGLVRSDPVADPSLIMRLYRESALTYADQIPTLKLTYGRYLDLALELGARRGGLLEIGAGNGFFLEVALERGFRYVRGVEPSTQAVLSASERVRSLLTADVMRPGLFPSNQFDVVCMFQVLDHMVDPMLIVSEALDVLRPGGFVLCLNHNVEALSARVLRERSPIVDIEHTYLYAPDTMSRLFTRAGFVVKHVGSAVNESRLVDLARLAPLSPPLRRAGLRVLQATRVGRLRLSLPLGNVVLVAEKPWTVASTS